MPDTLNEAKLFKIITNNLPVGYMVINKEGLIVEFNKTAENITGFSRDEVLGTPHELFHASPATHACPLLEHVFAHRQGAVNTETEIVRKDGLKINISVTTIPLLDENGVFHGGAALFRNITSLKKMQRERENILSMFAHDMKNPLLASIGFINRILDGKTGSITEKQQKYLSIVSNNMKNIEELITGFLDFSRLEQRECLPVFSETALVPLVKKIFTNLSIAAERKKVELRFEAPPENEFLAHADPFMLERALTNIIANAVKYTVPKSTVTVSLTRQGASFLFSVADTGPGIPPEKLPLIFEPFYRGENHDGNGSGLGLAISKTILACHGGTIEVESCQGKGSTFFIRLPQGGMRQP